MEAHTDADARTETKRFDADAELDATDLIVGDRIDPLLVASTMDGLGERRSPAPDAATTQLARATITNGMDDVHSAILVDGETGRFVATSRHDSQSAWSQKEADWKVREVGERVRVTDADVEQDENDNWADADEELEAERWANIVLQERAHGATDLEDELTLDNSSSLVLNDPWGAKVYATIELTE